jgi:Concanavalin A-like lectin/glucanases superfamily
MSYNNGQWRHLVATLGTAGMSLYVDGSRVGVSSTNFAQAYDGYWRVGGDNLGGRPQQADQLLRQRYGRRGGDLQQGAKRLGGRQPVQPRQVTRVAGEDLVGPGPR